MARTSGGGLFGRPDALYVDEEAPRIRIPPPPPSTPELEPVQDLEPPPHVEEDDPPVVNAPLRLFVGRPRSVPARSLPPPEHVETARTDRLPTLTPLPELDPMPPDSPTNPGGRGAAGPLAGAAPTVPEGWMLPSEMDQLGSVFGAPRATRVPSPTPPPPAVSSPDLWDGLQGPGDPDDHATAPAAPPPRVALPTAPLPEGPRRRGLAGMGQPLVPGARPDLSAEENDKTRPAAVFRGTEQSRNVAPYVADEQVERSHHAARSSMPPRRVSLPPTRRLEDIPLEKKTYVPLRVRPRRDIARAILTFLGLSFAGAAGVTVGWMWTDPPTRPKVTVAPTTTAGSADGAAVPATTPTPVTPSATTSPTPTTTTSPTPNTAPATPTATPVAAPVAPGSATPAAPVKAPAVPSSKPVAKAPPVTTTSAPTVTPRTSTSPALYAQTGMLRILSDERAVVYVDGKRKGWSNDLPPLELASGMHTIKAVSGGRSRTMQARIDVGRMSEVRFRFR